ncbi:unnamed protein product [Toxocara canis]|uniref:protein-tyrosine-phosphatase n=1 Tax=Toxocara canis TaxID=6265 RepID=A0A183VAA9_TOXCA|nr:unnamed protein product [Toxocara canis]
MLSHWGDRMACDIVDFASSSIFSQLHIVTLAFASSILNRYVNGHCLMQLPVRRVPSYFSYKLERLYKVGPGGAINLTCVAVGYPMSRVFWKKSDDIYLNDPQTAPIGKNVLTLTRVEQTENYTCIAVSKLGNIEATTTVEVRALPPAPRNLRIIEVTADSVTVRWDELIIENEPVKSYVVRYRQKNASTSRSHVPTNGTE